MQGSRCSPHRSRPHQSKKGSREMIGIIANPAEHSVVREFFELFKTPWEFYRSDRKYEVIVCAADADFDKDAAKVTLIYGGQKLAFDSKESIAIASPPKNDRVLSHNETRIPIYGDCIRFQAEGSSVLRDEESQLPAVNLRRFGERLVGRIGYNLFGEVRTLLTTGQPVANAAMPALDLHIALLRDLIVAGGVSLVEVPPVPDGYRFIACLTHDVDHPSIRLHRLDHTMFGFLYRAVFGSLFDVVHGRMRFRNLLRNWAAVVKLPFVHMGIANDFWLEFGRYAKLEKGLRSSFFNISFKDRRGQNAAGLCPTP